MSLAAAPNQDMLNDELKHNEILNSLIPCEIITIVNDGLHNSIYLPVF